MPRIPLENVSEQPWSMKGRGALVLPAMDWLGSEIGAGRVIGDSNSSVAMEDLSFCAASLTARPVDLAISTAAAPSYNHLLGLKYGDLDHQFWASTPGAQEMISKSAAGEFDAENLCHTLLARISSGALKVSDEFLAVLKEWRRDEIGHTIGFLMLRYLFTGEPVKPTLEAWSASRHGDFSKYDSLGLLGDERSACAVIAFDELVTVELYKGDRGDYTSRLAATGNSVAAEQVDKWFTGVMADEAHHFINFAKILKLRYPDQIPQIEQTIDLYVSEVALSGGYGKTFLGDYQYEVVDPAAFQNAKKKLLAYLAK